jgi:hypothetical protein
MRAFPSLSVKLFASPDFVRSIVQRLEFVFSSEVVDLFAQFGGVALS